MDFFILNPPLALRQNPIAAIQTLFGEVAYLGEGSACAVRLRFGEEDGVQVIAGRQRTQLSPGVR